jgi:hypothetical protein
MSHLVKNDIRYKHSCMRVDNFDQDMGEIGNNGTLAKLQNKGSCFDLGCELMYLTFVILLSYLPVQRPLGLLVLQLFSVYWLALIFVGNPFALLMSITFSSTLLAFTALSKLCPSRNTPS